MLPDLKQFGLLLNMLSFSRPRLCFLTHLPVNLFPPLTFTITLSSVLISAAQWLFISKGTFCLCVRQETAMILPAQIIWQSPLFSIASARLEPQQNANMGESGAFLLTTQPYGGQTVKRTIVAWLGMEAGGKAAGEPSPPPPNHGQW